MNKNKQRRGRPRLAASEKKIRVCLALPPKLATWLGEAAARRGGSLSQEAARLLEAARQGRARSQPLWQARLGVDADQVAALCGALKVKRLSIFGSVLGDRFRPDSDVDLLVEFQPGAIRSLLDRARAKVIFEDLFGRPVDLAEAAALENPIRRKAILDSAELVYAAQ